MSSRGLGVTKYRFDRALLDPEALPIQPLDRPARHPHHVRSQIHAGVGRHSYIVGQEGRDPGGAAATVEDVAVELRRRLAIEGQLEGGRDGGMGAGVTVPQRARVGFGTHRASSSRTRTAAASPDRLAPLQEKKRGRVLSSHHSMHT